MNTDEFKYCKDKEGYYITRKAERKMDEETTIKTTTGHWKESKSNFDIFDKGQIVGCKNTFIFFQADGKETAWRLNEYTAIPDIVPVDALTDTVRAKVSIFLQNYTESSKMNTVIIIITCIIIRFESS